MGKNPLLPLDDNFKVCSLAFLQSDDLDKPTFFFRSLTQATENDCELGYIDESIKEEDIQQLHETTSHSDIFIFPLFYKSMAYNGSIGNSVKIKEIIDKFSGDKNKIIILFGNPYITDKWELDANTLIIKAFSDSLPSIAAVIMKIDDREISDSQSFFVN